MIIGSAGNIIHNTSMPSVESPRNERKVSGQASGTLQGKPVFTADGSQVKRAQDNAADYKAGFASKLFDAGWSVVSLPATLFNAVTSALGSMIDQVINTYFVPKESQFTDEMRDMELSRLSAHIAKEANSINSAEQQQVSGSVDTPELSATDIKFLDEWAQDLDGKAR